MQPSTKFMHFLELLAAPKYQAQPHSGVTHRGASILQQTLWEFCGTKSTWQLGGSSKKVQSYWRVMEELILMQHDKWSTSPEDDNGGTGWEAVEPPPLRTPPPPLRYHGQPVALGQTNPILCSVCDMWLNGESQWQNCNDRYD